MKRTIFCVALILCMAIMAGCAAQASGKTQTPISAKTELTSAQKADDTAEVATALLPSQTVEGNSKTEDSADALLPAERVDTPTDAEAEKNPAPAETAPPAAPKQPVTPVPEDKPAPAPTPAPTQKPAEKQEEEPAPAPTPEPTPAPKPAASGDIYSIAEAIQAGNEYARAQYGVTIDTGMTTADSSYFPGTADSVAWLAENGGQAALTAAVKGNVDATFACLAAMDGAETVSAYARFNCTVRYDAASDEYIVVVLYG